MICTCCNNQYDDSFVSCPFCGTASAVSSAAGTVPCPKCQSPVMPGQPMCQQCGLINPAQNNSTANVTMPNVGDDAPANTNANAPRAVRIESDMPNSQNTPYQQAPFGQNQYGQYNQYNQSSQTQYGQYGQNTYTQNTVPPYMQNPYQSFANPNDPMYTQESKKVKTQAI